MILKYKGCSNVVEAALVEFEDVRTPRVYGRDPVKKPQSWKKAPNFRESESFLELIDRALA